MAFGYIRNGKDHLDWQLRRVRLRLKLQIAIEQAYGRLPKSLDVLERGFISPEVVEAELDLEERRRKVRDAPELQVLERACFEVEQEIEEMTSRSRDVGAVLPMGRLAAVFGLGEVEQDFLWFAVAGELDEGLRRIYAFLNNDITRPDLDVALITSILCRSSWERDSARSALQPRSPLMRYRLLVPPPHVLDDDLSVLRMPLRPASRIVDFLRDDDVPDLLFEGAVQVEDRASGALEGLELDAEELERIGHVLDGVAEGQGDAMCLTITGPRGTGKTTIARAVAGRLSRRLLRVDAPRLLLRPDTVPRLVREARLQGAVISVEQAESLEPGWRERLLGQAVGEAPVIVETSEALEWGAARPTVSLSVDRPNIATRTRIWARHLADAKLPTDAAADFSVRYPVTGGDIKAAVEAARRGAHGDVEAAVDTFLAQRRQHGLGSLATRVAARATWAQLILDDDTTRELERLVANFRHRGKLFNSWGLAELLKTGRGISALFEGPPGTGKTLAAGAIATEFDLELFQVDSSRVVSKYIGETEKNLARIFDEAERANAILLFDEADSLFAKRTEVKSSNDRHANLEVNFLLQRLDAFDGIVLLTTNFASSIDDAFARRLGFRVHFPEPDVDARRRLWSALIPSALETEGDIDYDELAGAFELSGGHIKNAIVRAAIEAASASSAMTFEHLWEAATVEYRSMGKLMRDGDTRWTRPDDR